MSLQLCTIFTVTFLLAAVSPDASYAQGCPIADTQLNIANQQLMGTAAEQALGLTTAQTLASLNGKPCILPLVEGLAKATYAGSYRPQPSPAVVSILSMVGLLASDHDLIMSDDVFPGMIELFKSAPFNLPHGQPNPALTWLKKYSAQSTNTQNLTTLVDVLLPVYISMVQGPEPPGGYLGSTFSNYLGVALGEAAKNLPDRRSTVISWFQAELVQYQPPQNLGYGTEEAVRSDAADALSHAGPEGMIVALDYVATTRKPYFPWDVLLAGVLPQWPGPTDVDENTRNNLEAKYLDAVVFQIKHSQCAFITPMLTQMVQVLGKRAGKAINELRQAGIDSSDSCTKKVVDHAIGQIS